MIEMKRAKNKRGQIIIVSFLLFFAALVVVSVLLDPMVQFIDVGINATSNTTNGTLIATLLNLLPLFIVLVLMISLFLIVSQR